MKTAIFESIPEDSDGRVFFDPSNGAYYHACGYLVSWFRREGSGWVPFEWAAYLAPEWTASVCDFLAGYSGSEIIEFS